MAHLRSLLIFILVTSVSSGVTRDSYKRCCARGEVLHHDSKCARVSRDHHWNSSRTSDKSEVFSCKDGPTSTPTTQLWNHDLLKGNLSGLTFCLERSINGSLMIQVCPGALDAVATGCDGLLTKVTFWGADIAMHMNIVHVAFCIVVVVVYMVFSDLGRRTYNRAVLRHNASLLSMGCTLTVLGLCTLCHQELNDVLTILLWLILQYFTLASAFWLNVICLDMTLVITQFRWLFGSFDNSEREENRRFLIYGIFAWGGALLPTLLAGILEICPEGHVSPLFKANYTKYKEGPNPTVNYYFFLIPLVTLFLNNILFVYTSYKIFVIQKSTAIVNRNQANVLWRKYFLFLRLYLLMGAPWFFGMLMACLNHLWILKTCRIVQPVLWLLMLVTHKKLRKRIAARLGFSKSDNQSCENSAENRK